MKEYKITSAEANQRLDKYLARLLPNAGKSFLYKMLRKKNIVLNKKKAEGNEILKANDLVQIYFSQETFQKFTVRQEEEDFEWKALVDLKAPKLSIIYEGPDFLAVNKPVNMLSQKAKPEDLSINEYLLHYLIKSGFLTKESFASFHPSVVNRLDRNTTGLLLMGKTRKGSQDLSRQLKDRSIQKYYYAVVKGSLEEPFLLKGYLQKDERTNRVTIIDKVPEGKEEEYSYVETGFKPLLHKKDLTLLEVHLITGKTHQIRAHLSSIGHPIIGDPKYGDLELNQKYKESYGVRFQMLHAQRMVFPGGKVILAEPPKTFETVMGKIDNCVEQES